MKKLFLFIICAVLSIGVRAQYSGSGNGTESNPYIIQNVYQLAQVANFLNQEGVVFELKMDIDLSGFINENNPSQGWDPIGVESAPFKGVLKGNGHIISGLYVKRTNTDNVGLFGYISGATIQDLSIKASSIEGKDYVGGFVGYSALSTLKNITITVGGSVKGSNKVGGMIGYASDSNLDNAVLGTKQVEGANHVGGVIGYANGSNLTNADFSANQVKGISYVGGVIGYASGGNITTCNATCNVTSTSNVVGGIVGYLSTNTVSAAKATGNVSGITSVGGGFGQVDGTSTLSNVTSIGDIVGITNVSGIAGELTSSSIVTFASCFSKGKITNSGDYTGGIVGKSNGICINSMDDCTHFGDIVGKNYVGGLVGAVLKLDAATPTLGTYEIRASASSNATTFESYSDQIEIGGTITQKLNNCAAIGNIEGIDYVGGLVGESLYATVFTSSSSSYEHEYPRTSYGVARALWKNGVFVDYYVQYMVNSAGHYCWAFPRTIYTKHVSTISLENSYYSGNISASKYAGGLIGHKVSGGIQNCYTYSTINGSQYVGGIVGFIEGYSSTHRAVVKSTIANNTSVTVTATNVGRIYGASGGNITIGALASPEGNRALAQTNVVLSGVAQEIVDNEQNGTSVGPYMLKLKANYVSWGWNFDENWKIEETECYPYKKYQAAPPVILSQLESHDTSVSGKAMDGGTVFMRYKNNDAVSTVCNRHDWTFTTEELQSGAQVSLYTEVDGLVPSYYTTATVKFPGSGTEEDPYRIYTAEDLQGATKPGYYKVMNDIDLTSWINENSPVEGWKAIGRNSSLATYIDGDNHKITGLWTNTTEPYNGLFSSYNAGYIKNLTVSVADGKKVKGSEYNGILIGRIANSEIVNCHILGEAEGANNTGGLAGYSVQTKMLDSDVKGKVTGSGENVGGLTAYAENCEVENCFVEGTINSTTKNNCYVGGLIGTALLHGIINKCYSNTNVSASGTGECGGLVGHNDNVITSCYSTGSVTSTGDYTGGLVGLGGNITNCYSTANVSGNLYSAGLVAYTYGKIDKCYASGNVKGTRWGGGLVGELDGPEAGATNSFAMNIKLDLTAQESWASRVIGGYKNGCADPTFGSNYALSTMQVTINGVPQTKFDDTVEGVAKTESELKSASTYATLGWDMKNVWSIEEGKNYPLLKGMPTSTSEVSPTDIAVTSISLSKSALEIKVNNSTTITATILPENATNKNVTWTSSNPEVATVENGVVTAVAEGNAVITAKATDGSNKVATCNVTVVKELNEEPDTDIAGYENIVYINNAETRPGSQVTLSVQMNNNDAVYGYQFELHLPDGITVATETDSYGDTNPCVTLTTTRTSATRHIVESSIKDGVLTVLCYSTKKYAFINNEGEVAQIVLNVADNVEAGNYPVVIKAEAVSLAESTPNIEFIKSTLTISDYKPGDANGDTKINVGDITAVAGYILGSAPSNFVFKGADANQDTKVNVGDITTIAGMILSRSANNAKARFAHEAGQVQFALADVIATNGNEVVVPINVVNSESAFSSFQFDMNVPSGFAVKSITANSSRVSLDYFEHANVESGACRVLGYSLKDSSVRGTEGAIAYVTLVAENVTEGSCDLAIRNAVFSNKTSIIEANDAQSAITVTEATGILGTTADSEMVCVYDVNGRAVKTDVKAADCLSGLSKGVYIINGVKIVK